MRFLAILCLALKLFMKVFPCVCCGFQEAVLPLIRVCSICKYVSRSVFIQSYLSVNRGSTASFDPHKTGRSALRLPSYLDYVYIGFHFFLDIIRQRDDSTSKDPKFLIMGVYLSLYSSFVSIHLGLELSMMASWLIEADETKNHSITQFNNSRSPIPLLIPAVTHKE
jgi:hypothetical protein